MIAKPDTPKDDARDRTSLESDWSPHECARYRTAPAAAQYARKLLRTTRLADLLLAKSPNAQGCEGIGLFFYDDFNALCVSLKALIDQSCRTFFARR